MVSDVGGDIIGYNLYAYCHNNPINMGDDNGNWPKVVNDAKSWRKDQYNKKKASIGDFFKNNFGAQIKASGEKSVSQSYDFSFFKITISTSEATEIKVGTEKTVTAYADVTEMSAGIQVKGGKATGTIATGLDAVLSESASVDIDGTAYSTGYKERVFTSEHSFSISRENMTQTYGIEINKYRIALAACGFAGVPVKELGRGLVYVLE